MRDGTNGIAGIHYSRVSTSAKNSKKIHHEGQKIPSFPGMTQYEKLFIHNGDEWR